MNPKRIVVTGGAGFLGKPLCRALAKEGHLIKIIDVKENPEFPTVLADIQDKSRMLSELQDTDVVFHLAALIESGESVKFPQKFIDVNITGSLNILEAMRQNGVKKFIFSSSAAVYGEPIRVPILEDDRTIPINPYGMTKLAMEALLSSYVSSFGITGIALRYFNLYGPQEHHEPETHAIPRFIKQIYDSKEVTVWGKGQHKRDFIHVADVVDAHINALELSYSDPDKFHYMNLSTQQPCSVLEVIQLIERAVGKKARIKHFPERPGDPLLLYADASKARQQLNWESKITLQKGIQETVEYFLGVWDKKS